MVESRTPLPVAAEARLELRVLTTLASLVDAEGVWRALDRRSTARLVWFQSFAWCFNWMRRHGESTFEPHVLMMLDDAGAVAVLPLLRRRNRLGITSLSILGEPNTQYANVLTRDGALQPRHIEMLRSALQSAPGIDHVSLPLVPDISPLNQVFPAKARIAALDNAAAQISLAAYKDGASYQAALDKKALRILRKSERLLKDEGEIGFAVLKSGDSGYREAVSECLAMKARWLQQTGRFSQSIEQDNHAAFLCDVGGSLEDGTESLAFVLTIGGKPAAIELGYLQRTHYYSYMGAFDWSVRHASPGKMQLHKAIQWLIGQGADTVDLLANPSEYKLGHASHMTPLAGYVLNLTWRGAGYSSAWTTRLKPALKDIFGRLPVGVRIRVRSQLMKRTQID